MRRPSEILTTEYVEPAWVVKGIIPRGTMIIIAGEAGAGKSSLMYDLCYAVAAGRKFLDHQTFPTRILYFDEENAEPDHLQYNRWAWTAHGQQPVAEVDEWLRIGHYDLLQGWKEPLAMTIAQFKPGLVIIDTATPAFHIQDENDNAEANRALQDLRRIRLVSGDPALTYIILKHERQRDDVWHRRTVRGAKTWLGAVDQVLYHTIAPGARRRKDGTRKTRLEPDKLRAYGLGYTIGIDPQKVGVPAKSLILRTYQVKDDSEPDDT